MYFVFESVCIVTNDTETGLGSYYSQKHAGKLYIEMWTNPKRLFSFSKIELNKKLCEAMLGLHAVTVFEFTSSFYGLGKTKGFNWPRKNYLLSDELILLDDEANLNETTIQIIKRFMCEFYGKQSTAELSDVRYQIFCGKTTSEYHQLRITLRFILNVKIIWPIFENETLVVILRS